MLDTTAFTQLSITRTNNTLAVTIDTKHKANVLSMSTLRELRSLALEINGDPSIAAVILSGQSAIFCGGMNLMELVQLEAESHDMQSRREMAQLGAKMCKAWEDIEAVTFAAIEGPCVGGGVALSLAADFRICSETAMIYVPEIERGMNMSWQSVPRSVSLIGPAKTKRMFLLADKVNMASALDWGWADYGCKAGLAMELATKIERMPAIPMRMCKEAINVAANALNHAVSYMDSDQLLLMQHSEDYQAAIESFTGKSD